MNTIIVLVCGVSVATLYQDQFSSFPVFSCHTEDVYDKKTVGKIKIKVILLSFYYCWYWLFLESYCWSRLYFLNISGSCGGFAETAKTEFVHQKDISIVNSFKIVFFYLFAEILVLNLPFCLWSRIDNQQAIQKIGLEVAKFDSVKVKSDHLCNFVIKYLNCHESYVKIFLLTELLNLAFSFGSFSFLFFYRPNI